MSLLRIWMVGDQGVGKTSLVTKFIYNNPDSPRDAHISSESTKKHGKQIQIDDRTWNLEITSGIECWRCLDGHEVACCVLVYDVYNRTSFVNLQKHIDDFVALVQPKAYKFKYVVLGNKIDMDRRYNRAVSKEEALQWCYDNREALYFETSAKDGNNVDAAFAQIARCAIGYIPHLRLGQVYNLQDIVQNDDLIGLYFESRERWLEASEVYLIKNHMNILCQYKSELPYSPTPGLFLTSTNFNDVAGIVWMDYVETTLETDPDDEREPVEVSYAWCSMDGKTMGRYIYYLRSKVRGQYMCLVHYMIR